MPSHFVVRPKYETYCIVQDSLRSFCLHSHSLYGKKWIEPYHEEVNDMRVTASPSLTTSNRPNVSNNRADNYGHSA